MGQNYLLVEGVNLDASINDTDQLSIIRGSSFLYKNLVDELSHTFRDQLTSISTGASAGLFQIAPTASAAKLAQEISNFCNQHPAYQHLSVLIEHCVADNILQAKQRLQTQLRWRQLNALSQVPDKQNQRHPFTAHTVSQLEGVRIAGEGLTRTLQNSKRALSLSEQQRWQEGVKQKRNYYATIAQDSDPAFAEQLNDFGFAATLEDLCACQDYSQLNGKMAVIYSDGNGFGQRQFDYLTQAIARCEDGVAAQRRFDDNLQQQRADFLTTTLRDFVQEKYPHGLDTNDDGQRIIRLETLLWGGDEMLFVLPAWLGFEVLQQFYAKAEQWQLSDGKPLTHATGIIFCKAKTPIRIIRHLAERLANRVKDQCSREQSAWDYMVLESVDYPTHTDLDDYFAKRYTPKLAALRPSGHFIKKDQWPLLKEQLVQLLQFTTAHQLFQLTEKIQQYGGAGAYPWQDLSKREDDEKTAPLSEQEIQEQRLLAVMPSQAQRAQFIELSASVAEGLFSLDIQQPAERAWFWLHLMELWNYLDPKAKQEQAL